MGVASLSDMLNETQKRELKEKEEWDAEYDGTTCSNCSRLRILKCENGKRYCEKCLIDPDTGRVTECPSHAR